MKVEKIDGLYKLKCNMCGKSFSELKFRNGMFYCRDCRRSDRAQAFIDGHVKPVVAQAEEIVEDFSEAALEEISRKLHDMESRIVARIMELLAKKLGL